MAARTKRIVCDENTRKKIQATQLIKRLTKHILTFPDSETFTKEFMHTSQVNAALGLLKKILPDLAIIDLKAEVTVSNANELTDTDLASIAASSSTGVIEQTDSSQELH